MKIAILVEDQRDQQGNHYFPEPIFHAAVEALLQGMQEQRDMEVHIICCARKPMPSLAEIGRNLRYHSLTVSKFGWMTTAYQGCIRAVRRKLREIEPDIVHGQGTERNCAMEAAFSGYPNVLTLHGNMREVARFMRAKPWSYHGLSAGLEVLAMKRTYGVFCNSSHTESLARPLARQCWRVPNPVRLPFFAPANAGPVVPSRQIINIGTVCAYKRQLEVLELAAELHRRGVDVEFLFLGGIVDDDYGAAFRKQIAKAEREGYARYLGTLGPQEMVPVLDQCGAMLHLSVVESFGLVVAEGLARNLKFFGCRVGGVVDIASNVEGAELYEENDWEGMLRGITAWAQAGYPRPATASATMAARYHPRHIADRHLEIYREVLKRA